MLKRGDSVINEEGGGYTGVILGPEDWEDYDRNKPSDLFELVLLDKPMVGKKGTHTEVWVGKKWLRKIDEV